MAGEVGLAGGVVEGGGKVIGLELECAGVAVGIIRLTRPAVQAGKIIPTRISPIVEQAIKDFAITRLPGDLS